MESFIAKVPTEEIHFLLPENIRLSTKPSEIIELPISSEKKLARKRFYRLMLDQNRSIHLSYGKFSKNIYQKALSFNKAFPQLSCTPLFINEGKNATLFGQEYFDGRPIDESFDDEVLSEAEIVSIIKKIQETLLSLERTSTVEAMQKEFIEFKTSLLKSYNFSDFDYNFLSTYFFSYIEKKLTEICPTLRWSNGDMAARNILIGEDKNFKIVDYEFANETHFHNEDWVRLKRFSKSKFQETEYLKKYFKSIDSVYEKLHFLKQILMDKTVYNLKDFINYTSNNFLEFVLHFQNHATDSHKSKSLLLEGYVNFRKQSEIFLENEKKLRLSAEDELKVEEANRISIENDLLNERKLRVQNEEILEKKLLNLETELILRNDKIFRIQSSFSWKITSPLRFLRRITENILSFRQTNNKTPQTLPSHSDEERLENLVDLNPFEIEDKFSGKLHSFKPLEAENDKVLNLTWLIPDFGIGSGSHTTIFRTIMWLEKFGHLSKIFICGSSQHGSAQKAKKVINSHFFTLDSTVEVLIDPSQLDNTLDPIISTSYETCYFSRGIDSSAKRFYFVQDYEPEFMPIGSYYYLAKETYSFGFSCITAGEWLASKIMSEGANVAGFFELAVDKDVFFPAKNNRKNNIPQIAVYCRSATPRRMTEIVIYGLNLLKLKGYEFKVCFFGDKKLPVSASFEYEIVGVLSPLYLARLYRSCDFGCVFSGTNYSLVPVEMMACGIPVLEFDGQNTRQTYPDGSVIFAEPKPQAIANSLESLLLAYPNHEQRKAALNYVEELSWEDSVRKIESIIKTELLN